MMKLNSKKVFYGMTALVVLLIIGAIMAVYVGNKMLKNKSNELVSLKLENEVLDKQQTSLQQAKRDVEKYAEFESIAKSIVPQDKDQAKTVREIVKIAQDSGITVSSVTFPTSNLGTAAPKATNNANQGDSAENSEKKSTTPAQPPVTQVKPVDGIKGVYELEITLQSDTENPIPYNNLISFLTNLEKNRRTAQVSQISIQPDTNNIGSLSFNLVIKVYIKP